MDFRRLLLAFAIFLLLSAMIGSLGSGPRRDQEATKPPPQRVTAPPREITGTLPDDEIVRARPGDLVKVAITGETADTAEIVDLGLQTQVAQDFPGELEFLAGEPGTYPVTLQIEQRTIGQVKVLAPK